MSVVQINDETTRPGGITGAGFQPGVSGNPGGRPKGLSRRVRELVGDDGEAILTFLLSVMLDDRERTRDRLEAARLLAERGWGKAVQAVEVDTTRREWAEILSRLPTADLHAMLEILERNESQANSF